MASSLAQTATAVTEWKGDVFHPEDPPTPVDVELSTKFIGPVLKDRFVTEEPASDCEGFDTLQDCLDDRVWTTEVSSTGYDRDENPCNFMWHTTQFFLGSYEFEASDGTLFDVAKIRPALIFNHDCPSELTAAMGNVEGFEIHLTFDSPAEP